jgi:hypothetical protein
MIAEARGAGCGAGTPPQQSCDRHRPGSQDVAGPVAGDPCRVSIDLPRDVAAPAEGDWIVTGAGSRYLVTASRLVRPRAPRPLLRYQLRCLRLARKCPVPADVRAIGLRWYRR